MGKIRAVTMGDEEAEKEAKRKAQARRQTKQAKKAKVEGVGLRGGERTAVVEGTDIKPEYKKLVEEVEEGKTDKPATAKAKAGKKETKVRQRSKKYKDAKGRVDKNKLYPLTEAITLVKKTSLSKFDGTVEMHVNLNPLVLGEKKDLRGTVSLPHGTGRKIKVAIADDDILEEVNAGKINFDVLVAHPSMMPKLARVAKILGPKGLMPNPKNGTVTPDVEKKAKELSAGQVNYKTEPDNPIIHMSVGKISFEPKHLEENITAVISSIGKGKISKVTLAATMGPGIKIEL
jgi:large subunit ribosomal protein L1